MRLHRGKTRIQDLPSSTICQMKGGTGGIWGGGGWQHAWPNTSNAPLPTIYTTLLTREDLSQAAHRDFTQGITMFTRSWKYKHTVQTKIFSLIIRCLLNIKKSDLYNSTCHPWCLLNIFPIVRLVSEVPGLFPDIQKQRDSMFNIFRQYSLLIHTSPKIPPYTWSQLREVVGHCLQFGKDCVTG